MAVVMVAARVAGRLAEGAVAESLRRRREPIPATPRSGGLCTAEDFLEPGDIIGSTTAAAESRVIRYWTRSDISHVMIYVGLIGDGGSGVVEAVGEGVVQRSLERALAESVVGAAFRRPGLLPNQRRLIRDFLLERSREGLGYNTLGAIEAGTVGIPRRQNGGPATDYFCSELLFAAYEHAGVGLGVAPHRATPQSVIDLFNNGRLQYVGHVKTTG